MYAKLKGLAPQYGGHQTTATGGENGKRMPPGRAAHGARPPQTQRLARPAAEAQRGLLP